MKKSQKGFSLVEVIVYVSIFSVFVGGLAQFSNTLSSSRLQSQRVHEVNDQGATAIREITRALRNADSVIYPTRGNTGASLSIDPNITFSEDSGTLYTTPGSGSPIALTNNKVVISNLLFSNFSLPNAPDIIQVSFTLASGSYSAVFTGTGALRK